MSDAKPTKTLREIQDSLLLETYRLTGNNKTATAKALGVSTKTVYNRLKRLGAKR